MRALLVCLTALLTSCGPGLQILGNAVSFTGVSGSMVNVSIPANTSSPSVYTIESFVIFYSFPNNNNVVTFWGPASSGPALGLAVTNAGQLVGVYQSGSCAVAFAQVISNTIITTNKKYHLAFTHDGTMPALFINGVKEISPTVNVGATTLPCLNPNPFTLGGAQNEGTINGILDEVRFSGVVRYTSDFTVPSRAFESDSNTFFLFHMNDTSRTSGTLLGIYGYGFNFIGSFYPQYVSSPFP